MEGTNQKNQVYSVKEVLGMTVNRLMNIQVPVGMIENIGLPIADVINALHTCIQALQDNSTTQDGTEQPEEEPKVSAEVEPELQDVQA